METPDLDENTVIVEVPSWAHLDTLNWIFAEFGRKDLLPKDRPLMMVPEGSVGPPETGDE